MSNLFSVSGALSHSQFSADFFPNQTSASITNEHPPPGQLTRLRFS